jgi:hypothetical protein
VWTREFPLMKIVPFPGFTDDEALPCLPRELSVWQFARRGRRHVHNISDCCWYHGGNWHTAVQSAPRLLGAGSPVVVVQQPGQQFGQPLSLLG